MPIMWTSLTHSRCLLFAPGAITFNVSTHFRHEGMLQNGFIKISFPKQFGLLRTIPPKLGF